MKKQQNCYDGDKRYASFTSLVDSTVAPLQFKCGALQGNLLLGFYFMAAILFSNTIFKDIGMISSITQPGEGAPVLIETVLCMTLQLHLLKEEPLQMLKDEKDKPLKTILQQLLMLTLKRVCSTPYLLNM